MLSDGKSLQIHGVRDGAMLSNDLQSGLMTNGEGLCVLALKRHE
jgi:hypothetical protein